MSIPCGINPMGSAGLPAGYERVKSVLKPDGAYWQTDIPVKTGMRLEADIEVTVPGTTIDFITRNGNEIEASNSRLQYLYVLGGKIYAGRLSSDNTGISAPNTRFAISVAQYSAKTEVLLNNGASSWVRSNRAPLEIKDETFFLGRYRTGGTSIYTRGSIRIYDLAMYAEGTNKCLFHFVPIRKLVNGAYSYGLYDVVNRKELPVLAGIILP